MISFAAALPVGNAVSVIVAPPPGTARWLLLRKLVPDFAGWNDPDAGVIADSLLGAEHGVIDTSALINGVPYYYIEFDTIDDVNWTPSPVISVTPLSNYQTGGPDVLAVVRDRIEAFLANAVTAGAIRQSSGMVPILTAPPLFQSTQFPLVTIHLRNDSNAIEGIGQTIAPEEYDFTTDQWSFSDGWLSRVDLQIIVWSLNPDERIALRQLVKAAIVGNLGVFGKAGMVNIDLSLSDIEDMESHDAPIYQTVVAFSCNAPFVVSGTEAPVTDVTVEATGIANIITQSISLEQYHVR